MLPRTFCEPVCGYVLTSLRVAWHHSDNGGAARCLAAGSRILHLLQFLPFVALADCLQSQQEHSEWLLPGRPGHGLVAGEFTYPLFTGLLSMSI